MQSAKLQLVAGNMGLVYKVAHQYHKSRTVSFADLVQAGVQGLDKGLRMYNPGRGAKLSTALFWYIRAAIGCTHRLEGQTIHIPLTTQEQIWRLNSVVQKYQLLHPGVFPPDQHVRKVTGWSKLSVTRIKQARALSERSYDVMARADGSSAAQMGSHVGESLIDSLTGGDTESEHVQRSNLMQMDVQSLVTRLPDPLNMVVQLRYGLQDGEAKSYEEVCLKIAVTCAARSPAVVCLGSGNPCSILCQADLQTSVLPQLPHMSPGMSRCYACLHMECCFATEVQWLVLYLLCQGTLLIMWFSCGAHVCRGTVTSVLLLDADMQVAKCLNLSAYKVAQHHRAALAVLQSSESLRQLASVF